MENYLPAGAATQPPVIESTARQLEKQIAELTEMVTVLEGRLSPVMREPEPSQIRPDKTGAQPAQSQMAVMLCQRVAEAESIASRLSSIMRRLEI